MNLSSRFSASVAELAQVQEEPEPQGQFKQDDLTWYGGTSSIREPPDADMRECWRAYRLYGPARSSINTAAEEIMEPGWFVTSDSDKTEKKIAEWLRTCSIIENEIGQEFALLLHKAAVQVLTRGTAFVEHVPSSSGDPLHSLQLLNAEAITAFTKPNSTILWPPDPDTEDINDLDGSGELPREGYTYSAGPDEVPQTDDGEFAAYVQFWRQNFDRDDIAFTRDEISKVSFVDADVGETFAHSPLKAAVPHIESLRKKLSHRDEAIYQKAWPTWVFQFGPDDDPWHPDRIDSFMSEEDEDAYGPGTKHGVQGDISIETVGGEVPDLEQAVMDDVNHIFAALPTPKFASPFAGQSGSVSKELIAQQKNRFGRKVKAIRRLLEYQFREILHRKAELMGLDTSGLELCIRPPRGEAVNEYEDTGTTIRYLSEANKAAERAAAESDSEGQESTSTSEGTGPAQTGLSSDSNRASEAASEQRRFGPQDLTAEEFKHVMEGLDAASEEGAGEVIPADELREEYLGLPATDIEESTQDIPSFSDVVDENETSVAQLTSEVDSDSPAPADD